MDGVLYYFSGTGNTRWAANKLKEQFKRFGRDIDVKTIEKAENINLKPYKYLIIGTPVHAEFPPRLVIDFIDKLPKGNNMKCIIYSTQGSNSAAAVDYMRKLLIKKGYNIVIQTSFRMANNYFFGGGVERTEEEIDKFSKKAEEKIRHVVEEFFNNHKVKESVFPARILVGKIAFHGFDKMLPKLAAKLSSTEECNKCGICLRNCPKGNITLEDGRAFFHSNCMMCTRCIHLCPVNAIRYKGNKINQIQKDKIQLLELK